MSERKMTHIIDASVINELYIKLARSLSPAQQRALLWLPDNGDAREEENARLATSLYAIESREIAVDIEAHLVSRSGGNRMVNGVWERHSWRATPLGIKVREHLSKMRMHAA